MELLAPSFCVSAPDFYGDGKSPPLREDREFDEDRDIELIQSLLDTSAPFHLIGHSYGGAIAVRIALLQPEKVLSLSLYEPALWGMLESNWPREEGTQEISTVRNKLVGHLLAGRIETGCEDFIDYWMGPRSWERTPDERKPVLAAGVRAGGLRWVRRLGYPLAAADLSRLPNAMLLMQGSRTTAAARAVVTHLRELLPNARFAEFDGLGHMGPVTHAAVVNEHIRAFLQSIQGTTGGSEASSAGYLQR
jgi:pimeloyl-ACP methyl ester carboxylesterase